MRDPILVVGVGRCGTSEVCRVLESLGVDFGGRGTVRESNPNGDYEHMIIKRWDGHYLDGEIGEAEWRTAVAAEALGMDYPWGYKHPRGVSMLEVYDRMWPDAKWVWCWRDTDNVVASWSRWYDRSEKSCKNSVKRRLRKVLGFFADRSYTFIDMTDRRTEQELADILRPIVVEMEGP